MDALLAKLEDELQRRCNAAETNKDGAYCEGFEEVLSQVRKAWEKEKK